MNDADYAAGATTGEVESITRRSFLGVLLGFGTVVVGAVLSVPSSIHFTSAAPQDH